MKIQQLCCAVLLSGLSAMTISAESGTSVKDGSKAEINRDLCLFSGRPPSDLKYTTVTQLKLGKGSYGSVIDVLPGFAAKASAVGADAVINYTGSQRFGFWPWRIVRPVARGEAIKWTSVLKRSCSEIGGTTVGEVIASGKAPVN